MTALKNIRARIGRMEQIPISSPARGVSHGEERHKLVDVVQTALSKVNVASLRPPRNPHFRPLCCAARSCSQVCRSGAPARSHSSNSLSR